MSRLEECDCTKSCRLPGGIVREDGASWSEGCQLCSCVVRYISSCDINYSKTIFDLNI